MVSGVSVVNHAYNMRRRLLFEGEMPAGVAEHLAFVIAPDAVHAARAKLFGADHRFAGPLAVRAEARYPVGIKLKCSARNWAGESPNGRWIGPSR